MRASPPARHTSVPADATALENQPDAIQRLIKPLLELAEHSDYLVGGSIGEFISGHKIFQLPRFIFMGPTGGGDIIRLGIFAALHGDEPEGAEALAAFLQELEATPQAARGYHIYAYPLCNPSGFVAGTRDNAAGKDLTRQFWKQSTQPEVYYLEREMGVLRLQGVISLQTENQADGFVVHTESPILDAALAQPAIHATRRFLSGRVAHGEPNAQALRTPVELPASFLTATDELNPTPFELRLGIPKQVPKPSQIHGTVNALKSILDSYRSLLSIRQNI